MFTLSRVTSATATACASITAEAALAEITGKTHADAVAKIRKAVEEGDQDRADALKIQLPGLIWGGVFTRRAIAGLKQRSGLIVADLDDLDDPAAVRDTMIFDDHVFAAFISPSGHGLKVVFRCDTAGDHAAAFAAMDQHVRTRYKITPDPSGKDVCRICFVSHDPEAHHNPEAVPLPPYDAPEEPAAVAQAPARVDPLPGGELKPGDDFNRRGAVQVPELLRSAGWVQVGQSENWTRPGKRGGTSATWNHEGCEALKVFTSNAPPFEAGKAYGPYQVLAMLRHGGDFSAASRELRALGYGEQRKKLSPAWDWGDPPEIEGIGPAEAAPAVEGKEAPPASPAKETEEEKIRRLLRERSFDPELPPPPLRPIFSLGGVVISTPGNLTAITAQAKVGKSALVSALTAAAMSPPESDADCLTAVGYNAQGKALLYFDTEQSPDDFWHAVKRAQRRARAAEMPGWIFAYSIADLPQKLARRAISVAMADASLHCEGVFAVIVDGVADLVCDVNDAEECNGLVAELHALAIQHDCAIVGVIHKNPGSEKVRGHLGSQLERKSETNLSMEKDGEVTVVWSAKQRRAPINRDTGPRFRWDDELKMHVTVSAEVRGPTNKVRELLELAESVLKPGQKMAWKELVSALQEARRTPNRVPVESTVDRWINAMRKAEIITITFGSYQLNPAHQLPA